METFQNRLEQIAYLTVKLPSIKTICFIIPTEKLWYLKKSMLPTVLSAFIRFNRLNCCNEIEYTET